MIVGSAQSCGITLAVGVVPLCGQLAVVDGV